MRELCWAYYIYVYSYVEPKNATVFLKWYEFNRKKCTFDDELCLWLSLLLTPASTIIKYMYIVSGSMV